MRSFLRVFLLLLISITCVTAMLKSNQKKAKPIAESKTLQDSTTDEEKDNDSSSNSTEVTSKEEEESEEEETNPKEFYSTEKAHVKKAWSAALKLIDRNPSIWRMDKQNNIILSTDYTISSPLAFRALVKLDRSDRSPSSVSFEAVQQEYYGADDEDNHENALKYKAKDQNQDDLLSLIEIALNGNVSDDQGNSYCWVPSEIHRCLFSRDTIARRWHASLFSTDFKYGMAGHNLAFQHMGVGLKDVRNYPESTLDALDQINDFMYIHNYQSQCSDVINQIKYMEDPEILAEKIKTNWGLPKVADFIDPTAVGHAPVVAKPKRLVMYPKSYRRLIEREPETKSTTFSEEDWPSLSSSASTPTNKSKTVKKNKSSIVN